MACLKDCRVLSLGVARERGYRMGGAEIYDSLLRDGLNDAFMYEHLSMACRGSGQAASDNPGGSGPVDPAA